MKHVIHILMITHTNFRQIRILTLKKKKFLICFFHTLVAPRFSGLFQTLDAEFDLSVTWSWYFEPGVIRRASRERPGAGMHGHGTSSTSVLSAVILTEESQLGMMYWLMDCRDNVFLKGAAR